MPIGITNSNVSPQAFTKLETEYMLWPTAADSNYISAATDGGAQGTFDASAAVVGTTIFLSVEGKKPFRVGRLPTMTLTDAAGANLGCTIRLVGRRFGRQVTQDFTWAAGATALLAGTKVIDEVVSATVVAISAGAFTTSDTLLIGIDGTRLGLQKPIKSVKSVKFVEKFLADAPGVATTAGIRAGSVLQVSTVVFVADSSIDMTATGMFTGSLAVTDSFVVQYVADGLDEWAPKGRKFG